MQIFLKTYIIYLILVYLSFYIVNLFIPLENMWSGDVLIFVLVLGFIFSLSNVGE
jgi:hypothetical protein